MASLPSHPLATQRQSSHSHQRTPSPTSSSARRPSRSSQSLTSEDSQTLLIGTPNSSSTPETQSPKFHSPNITEHATPGPSPESPNSEPRKCWICFSDETEDTPDTCEWVSPCPCALTAHQACLLDWVADLKAPNRKNAKKVQCPQCKAEIKFAQPRSLSVELMQYFDRVNGRLFLPAAGVAVVSGVVGGCYIHGIMTTLTMMGSADATRLFFAGSVNGRPSLRVMACIPLIPVAMVFSRTTVADGIFPVLPMFFLLGRQRPTRIGPLWPPSIMMTLCALPYIRSVYNGLHKRYLAPYEKAWLKQIQPRGGETADETPNNELAQQDADAENANEDGMMDFELGVQVEVIEEEEVEGPPPQPDNVPGEPQPQNDGNQAQQPPQPAPAAAPRHPMQQNILVNIGMLANGVVGAMLFPVIANSMGLLLRVTLPSRFTTPPRTRWGNISARPTGLLQTRWGRSLVGGFLFIVLKDALGFWARWSMKEDHKRRKVLNHGQELEGEARGESWWRRMWREAGR